MAPENGPLGDSYWKLSFLGSMFVFGGVPQAQPQLNIRSLAKWLEYYLIPTSQLQVFIK